MLFKDKGKYSISFTQDKATPRHSQREYTPTSADRSLADRNVSIISTENYKDEFNSIFEESILLYNKKQSRESRKKTLDYYSEIKNGKCHEKPCFEYVLMLGNRDTNGVTDTEFDNDYYQELKRQGKLRTASKYVQQHLNHSEQREELKEIMVDYCKKLPKRFPNFHFLTINIHDDEPNSACHAHICFIPVGNGYKNGMERRCSLSRALVNMGYQSECNNLSVMQWQADVKNDIEKAMNERHYARQYMNNTDKHLALNVFKQKELNKALSEKTEELNTQAEVLKINVRQKQHQQKELDEQARRIRTAQRQLKELQAELETKEKALAKREAELAQREKLLQDSNAVLKYREKALNKRERALRANEYVDKNIQTPQTQRPDRALPSFCE